MSAPEVGDEMVELLARRLHRERYSDGVRLDEHAAKAWNSYPDDEREPYRQRARGHLAALAASGWRREADVLREAGASIDRHVDSYQVVATQNIARLKTRTADPDLIRQRQHLERRYVRGLLAAMDDLYELAEEAEKREQAAALEHAQPLLAAGSEVESLEPVEPTPAEPVSSTGEEPTGA